MITPASARGRRPARRSFLRIDIEAVEEVEICRERARDERLARPVTVDGVGNKNAGAHDAEKRGDCFQHGNDPKTQRLDLTARVAAQSKGFGSKLDFESVMMFSCNTGRDLRKTLAQRVGIFCDPDPD